MKTNKIVLILLLAMALFAIGCGAESDNSSSSRPAADDNADADDDNGDNFNPPSGDDDGENHHSYQDFNTIFSDAGPIDACMTDDGSIWVAYVDPPDAVNRDHNALVRYNALHQVDWVYSGPVSFPHTLDCKGNLVLMSDCFDYSVTLLDSITLEATRIDFSDWYEFVVPNAAQLTPDGNILVSDLNNNTIIKITMEGEKLWEYMVIDEAPGSFSLHGPIEAADGHLLYCLSDRGKVVEVDQEGNEVWSYDSGLNFPKSVQRLDNGDTLIGDHERIIEVNQAKQIVWEFDLKEVKGFNVERLPDGNTLNGTSQVLMIAPDGTILWTLGAYSNILDESIIQQNKRLQMLRSIGYL
ncbi:MAG: PQQ-like beta-propeller repeat protein [Myxococcales bacterium]|nr:PQQ-like beta-propeller repeat protein [Myxococcales bacterium]